MAEINLGNVAGVVKSLNPPLEADGVTVKTYVIWGKILNPAQPNIVELYVYSAGGNEWVPLYNKSTVYFMGSVLNIQAAPPANPAVGDAYIIGDAATGAWVGRTKQVATWAVGGWVFTTPIKNSIVFNANDKTFYYFNNAYPAGLWDATATGGGGGGDESFNGNRAIKRVPTVGLNAGGATVREWLNNVYFPFVGAAISMDSFPVQMVGTVYTPKVKGTITPNDEVTISNRKIINVNSGVTLNSPAGNAIDYDAPALPISAAGAVNTYRIQADVAGNGVPSTISVERTVNGLYPVLYGMSDQNLGVTTFFPSLDKLLAASGGTKNLTFNGSNKYIYVLYPDEYPDAAIVDPNGFNALGAFVKTAVNVTSAGLTNNWTKGYKMYKSGITTVNGGTFKFTF